MFSMGKKSSALVLALLFFSPWLCGLIGAQAQQSLTVKIGDIAATTVDRADSEAISQIALADINQYMVDFNHPYVFQTVFADAGGTDSGHSAALSTLKAQGVRFILGGDVDSMAAASLSYVNSNGVLLLSSASRASSLAVSGDNLFRLRASDLNIGPDIARMLWSKGVRYACVLQRDDSWASGVYTGFDTEWRSLGGQYIGATVKYPTSTTLFTIYLDDVEDQIATATPLYTVNQIGLVVLSLDEVVTLIDQVGSRPYIASVNWYGTDRLAKNPAVLAAQRHFATNVHLYSPLESFELTLAYSDVAQRFTQITGRDMGDEDALRYDWYWIVAIAVLKSGSADSALVKARLPEVAASYIGATGWCALDEAGDRGEPLFNVWGYALVNNVYSAVQAGWIEYPPLVHWVSSEKPAITVTCTPSPSAIHGDESLLISGSTSPMKTGASMKIEFWDPEGTPTEVFVVTNIQGRFNTTVSKPAPGIWHLQARWAGDATSRASSSSVAGFTVYRTITSIAIEADKASILIGEGVRVNGTLRPGFPGAPIVITYTGPGGSATTKTVATGANGAFLDDFTPTAAGDWTATASFAGDLNNLASASTPIGISVVKKSTSVNVLLSATSVVEQANVSAYGQLTPPLSGKPITVTATSPSGVATNAQATTDSQGRYSATFHPGDIGAWSFSASYAGDGTYLASVSGSASLTVTRAPPRATIKVFVKDGQAKGLQGASVTSTLQPSGQSTLSGTTGVDGSVTFNLVAPGDYSFLAALSGYTSNTVSLTGAGGETTERTVVLQAAQSSGIPGFPVEAVALGALASIYLLLRRPRHTILKP